MPHQAMVLLLCRSADGVSFDSVKTLSEYRYTHCAMSGTHYALRAVSSVRYSGTP